MPAHTLNLTNPQCSLTLDPNPVAPQASTTRREHKGGTAADAAPLTARPAYAFHRVTASADCSVIGVVCRSDKRPELVPGSIDLIGAGGWGTANHECKCTQVAECTVAEPCSALNAGATTTSGPCTDAAGSKAYWDRRDDSMYLIEFTGATGVASRTGSVSNPTYVCVNKAIGGEEPQPSPLSARRLPTLRL